MELEHFLSTNQDFSSNFDKNLPNFDGEVIQQKQRVFGPDLAVFMNDQ